MAENLDDWCEMHKCHPTECRGRHEALGRTGCQKPPSAWTQQEWAEPPLSRGLWQEMPMEPIKYDYPSATTDLEAAMNYMRRRFDPETEEHIRIDLERAREFEREAYEAYNPIKITDDQPADGDG